MRKKAAAQSPAAPAPVKPTTPADDLLKLAETEPPPKAAESEHPPKLGARVRKKKKRKKAPTIGGLSRRKLAAVGLGAFSVAAVVVVVLVSRDRRAGGPEDTPANYAVVDEPVGGVRNAPLDENAKRAPVPPVAVRKIRPAADIAPAPEHAALWKIQPDKPPEAGSELVAADLNIPAQKTAAVGGNEQTFLFAAQNGPFLVTAPV